MEVCILGVNGMSNTGKVYGTREDGSGWTGKRGIIRNGWMERIWRYGELKFQGGLSVLVTGELVSTGTVSSE
jgi:hypothetical protein